MLKGCHIWEVSINVTKDSVPDKEHRVTIASTATTYGAIEALVDQKTKGKWPGFEQQIATIRYVGEGYLEEEAPPEPIATS